MKMVLKKIVAIWMIIFALVVVIKTSAQVYIIPEMGLATVGDSSRVHSYGTGFLSVSAMAEIRIGFGKSYIKLLPSLQGNIPLFTDDYFYGINLGIQLPFNQPVILHTGLYSMSRLVDPKSTQSEKVRDLKMGYGFRIPFIIYSEKKLLDHTWDITGFYSSGRYEIGVGFFIPLKKSFEKQ